MLWFCLNLQQRIYTVALSLITPPPWDGEESQKEKRQKLVGWDENSLTEWQREKKTTINNTDKKNIHRAMFSLPYAQLAPELGKPLLQPAAHLNTEHDTTWYRIPHLTGCLGQPNQLLVKINSVPAESSTPLKHTNPNYSMIL